MSGISTSALFFWGFLIACVVAVILIVVLPKKAPEKYKKCICNSRNERNCQDDEVVKKMYEDNVLTEYTNLKSPGWQQAYEQPGAITYPVSTGCPWPNEFKPEWKAWDFTEFIG